MARLTRRPLTPDIADAAEIDDLLPEPVPDCGRHDGWTAERQRRFIGHLAKIGSVKLAALSAGKAVRSAYRLRDRAPAFAQAWDGAMLLAGGRLRDEAWRRAFDGTEHVVRHHPDGVETERVASDRMLVALLRSTERATAAIFAADRAGHAAAADPRAPARTC